MKDLGKLTSNIIKASALVGVVDYSKQAALQEEHHKAKRYYKALTKKTPVQNLDINEIKMANRIIEYCLFEQGLNIDDSVSIAYKYITDRCFTSNWAIFEELMNRHLINFKPPEGESND